MTERHLRDRMLSGELLSGTFVKTPAYELMEVLALSGLDFVCLDGEHSPFDRRGMDASLALAMAKGLPALVRVPAGTQEQLLMALDSGAVGVVVPHVDTAEKARNIAKWSRFGHYGRGFAGSTRWANYATRGMGELLEQSNRETVVIAQIEEPEAVAAIDEICSVEGIDGVFVGPADMAVCLGKTDAADPAVREMMRRVGISAKKHGKCFMTFLPTTASARELNALGVTMFFVGSEQGWMLAGARQVAQDIKAMR
ncbi:MAG: HpcH/HpaI aldolase/citrate lyase family protein [Hyphomicrobiaceae bacterium]